MSLPDSIGVNVTLSVIKTGPHHSASISSIKDVTSFVKAEQRIIGMPVVAGKDGVDGADGEAATVTIGIVETLPPGSNAYVRNSGTDTDAVLDIGIPRGNAGEGASSWGDITGTLSDQTDLANALALKANSADLGDLATQDTVDYQTEVTNKPTFGSLASKDSVNYATEVTNKPSLGTMASQDDAPSDNAEYVRKNGAWAVSSGGGGITSVSWGDINGTLANQTDLVNALDEKAPAFIGNGSELSGQYIIIPTGEELSRFKATYNVTQSGTGTPSADNVRPFVSASKCNVCSGRNDGGIELVSSSPITLSSAIYSGVIDVMNGIVTVTHGYIASYNGETLKGRWYSDRDEYIAGTAPSIGAEVVYELATPVQQTCQSVTPYIFPAQLNRDTYLWATAASSQSYSNTPYTVDGIYVTLVDIKTYIDQGDALKANVADLGDLAYEDDAPSDSKEYVRKNGAWAESSGGGGGITSVAWGDVTGTLANQTDLSTALNAKQNVLTFDSAPTASSTNPVESGGIKTALDTKQDTLTFDTTPTANSTNPVESGGVKTALDAKQDVLSFDTTPTANSTRPVTSGGVYDAIVTGFRDVYKVTLPSASNSKKTFSAPGITANHVLCVEGHAYYTNKSAVMGELTLTTAADSITITGTLSGTTDIVVTLGIPRTITAS